jgi:NAD-reducing hydrogenase large subunit
MARTLLIDPVTRIEGHAKITVRLDDAGVVQDTRFHVVEFRGFEAFCRGRSVYEMPALTARTCGICPVSHVLTGAKAGDAILGVEPPPAARQLRRMMNLGQLLQSHALSFFHLSSPDLLLGFDSEPGARNVFGLIDAEPEIARRGIRMRRFGQEVIAALGGRKIHPAWAVPGGVLGNIDPEALERLRAEHETVLHDARWAWARYGELVDAHPAEVAAFGVFPSLFFGIVSQDGTGSTTTACSASSTPKATAWARTSRPSATPSSSARSPTRTPTSSPPTTWAPRARRPSGPRRRAPTASARWRA